MELDGDGSHVGRALALKKSGRFFCWKENDVEQARRRWVPPGRRGGGARVLNSY
jgi:hypothetical protein